MMSQNMIQGFLFEPRKDKKDHSDYRQSRDEKEDTLAGLDTSRMNNLKWCICGNCSIMPTVKESVCCKENPTFSLEMKESLCIINLGSFEKLCLDREVLEVVLASTCDFIGEQLPNDISNR